MKSINRFSPVIFLCCVAILTHGVCAAAATPVRTQAIQLRKGWNSVFLEVIPIEPAPAILFENTPVETVAAFFQKTRPCEYIRNPGDAPWREEGWGVWYARHRTDAFLSNLHTILGNQAYLIYSTEDFLWTVPGTVSLAPIQWEPNAYNLTGFPVDPTAPPTFEQFFAGSGAHRGQRIYRLVNGEWTPVQDRAVARMRSGEAYWVYCDGGSTFQGPLKLGLPSGGQLNFGSSVTELQLTVWNESAAQGQITIETFPGDAPLPMAYLSKDLSILSKTYPPLPPRLDLPALGAGQCQTLQLLVHREALSAPGQCALLRISNGQGVQLWVAAMASPLR